MTRRLGYSLAALATVAAAALAPPALAAGTMVEVDDVAGLIYSVDDTRILFRESGTAFAIKQRDSGQLTTVALAANRQPSHGYLTPHGAVLGTSQTASPFQDHMEELYDGVLTDHGAFSGGSLRAAGNFAIFSQGNQLLRRDVSVPPLLGAPVTISTGAGNIDNDVAANGDVAYWTTNCGGCPSEYGIARYRGGTTDTLAFKDATHWHTYPRTDGINVVWREVSPCCFDETGSIRGYGPSGPFTLENTTRNYWPVPDADYRVAGGYVAFTRGERGARQVWLRDKDAPFEETKIADGGDYVVAGLGEDGQVVYVDLNATGPNLFFLYRPGQGSVELGTVPQEGQAATAFDSKAAMFGGHGGGVFSSGGHWYLASGTSLFRFVTDLAHEAGSQTTITSGPVGADNTASATFEFSSSVASATFECKLDGAEYEACASPTSYQGLRGGPHRLAVRSVATGGQRDPDPATAAWVVETDPPVVTIDDPPAVTPDSTPQFGGSQGTAPEDAEVTLKVFVEGDPTPLRTVVATRTGGSWSANVTPALPDGAYTVRVEQRDEAGNVGVSAVKAFRVDSTPPQIALDHPNPVLTGHSVTFDATRSTDESTIVRYEWDLDGDGDFERDTGSVGTTERTYAVPQVLDVAARVTDAAGNTGVERHDMTVAPAPPPGLLGVTINGGDRFTNDPNVLISPVWRPGETEVILSNDGGFGDAVTAPLARNVPWRLDSSGPERLPKTLYARFSPDGTTYQDDIILDETPPGLILAAITAVDPRLSKAAVRKRRYHLHVKARDRNAGVSRMQITTNRRHPGKKRRFRNRPTFVASTSKIYVRVRDRAGNWSRWKRCETRLGTS